MEITPYFRGNGLAASRGPGRGAGAHPGILSKAQGNVLGMTGLSFLAAATFRLGFKAGNAPEASPDINNLSRYWSFRDEIHAGTKKRI